MTERHDGGCLCGQVRYRINGPVTNVVHCHCQMCRRASGAMALTWFTVAPDAFQLLGGQLKTWRSSEHGERGFCPGCGAQITFRHDAHPGEMDVSLATLDDAAAHPAARHIWTDSALPWLTLDPDLPAHARETPPGADDPNGR